MVVDHKPWYGGPALALDIMEEFRPLIADSAALTLFNVRRSHYDCIVNGMLVNRVFSDIIKGLKMVALSISAKKWPN